MGLHVGGGGGSGGSSLIADSGQQLLVRTSQIKTGDETNHPTRQDSLYQQYVGAQTVVMFSLPIDDQWVSKFSAEVRFGKNGATAYSLNLGPGLYKRNGGAVLTNVAAATSLNAGDLAGCSATMSANGNGVDVAVTVPAGTIDVWLDYASLDSTISILPVISSASPNHGASNAITHTTLAGLNLTTATSVTCDGVSCPFVPGAGNLGVDVPAAAGFTAHVTTLVVVTPAGSTSIAWTYDDPFIPHLSSVTPNHVAATGLVQVTLAGTNLNGRISCKVGGVDCQNFFDDSSIQVRCDVPAGSGDQSIVYVTAHGTTSLPFTYDAAIDPVNDWAAGNTRFYLSSQGITAQASGGFVTMLQDDSGFANHFHTDTTVRGPYNATGLGGHPAVIMNATSNPTSGRSFYRESGGFTCPSLRDLHGTGNGDWTVIVAGLIDVILLNDATTPAGGDSLWGDYAGYWGMALHNRGGGGLGTFVGWQFDTAFRKTTDLTFTLAAPHIFMLRRSGAGFFASIDWDGNPANEAAISSGALGTIPGAGLDDTHHHSIFSGWAFTHPAQGRTGIRIFTRQNNVVTAAAEVSALKQYYGITP